MSSTELERIVQLWDDELDVRNFPDYPNALNGLQVDGPHAVGRIAAAVDCTAASIQAAIDASADLLLVHHGLFWGGLQPLVGPFGERVSTLLAGKLAVYSAHLPLDAHREFGNCAILARRAGVEIDRAFGAYQGREIGWMGRVEIEREPLRERLGEVLGGEVRLIRGGPERISTVAVVTGGGASFLAQAASAGVDALITGEGSHHHYHEAMEMGVNLFLGGHYATETWGVRALARHAAKRFDLEWDFLDLPTGL